MRVLHISSPKTWRGGEQQLMYLVEELHKLNVWQMVMCPFNSSVHKYCLKNHINHITYYKGFSANPMVAFRVKHICSREGISLIHVHDSHAHNFAVLSAILSGNNLPIIVSRRVDFPVQGTAISSFKYNHPRIARIICVSDAIKAIMEPDMDDKDKLVTIYSGVDLDKFSKPAKVDLRTELGIGKEITLIGNVAALAPHKDYETFIRSAREIHSKSPDSHFVIIGDGPERKNVIQWIEDYGMKEHITMLGFRNDIVDILPQLDVFLITSETEGLGTSILDAQVTGVPIVATEAGGITEIVLHEETGLLAAVKDVDAIAAAVIRLIEDQELARKLVQASKERVKRFSKQETAKATKQVYEEVLSEAGDNADIE